MTPQETVILARYVKACCPGSQIDEYTPDAWHDLLGDLSLDDCRTAVAAVAKRQPFVAPAEIRAEVRRIREDRLARTPLPAPGADLADSPGRYRAAVRSAMRQIADGKRVPAAIGNGGGPLDGDPPPEWQAAKAAITPEPPVRDLEAIAREQAAESRQRRGESGEAS